MRNAINQIKILLRQFPIFVVLKLFWVETSRKLFDRYGVTSYSQQGEDRIIETILKNISGGFYVDVGCNHPFSLSNTARLYRRGWRGLNIDVNPEMIRLFRQLRPQDISVVAAISNRVEQLVFTITKASGMSSLEAPKMDDRTQVLKEIKVTTTTLTALLIQHNVPRKFEYLNVDVEGFDFEALDSLDFSKYRPKLISIEIHGFDLNNPSLNRVYKLLIEKGYSLVGYAVMTAFFQDNDDLA